MTPSPELPGADCWEWLADLLDRGEAEGHVCGPACLCREIAERPEVAEARRKRGPKPAHTL